MPTGIPTAELASVDLAGIVAYLQASGWRETGTYSRTVVWTHGVADGEAEVLVPSSAELRDFASRVADIARTLSAVERRPVSEVLRDLRSPTVDVQYIRTMPDGPSGTTPLHEGYLAVKGVRDLFLAAATSAVSAERPTVLPSTKPDQAKGFLDQVRLGPATRGSYVLRVETPLDAAPPESSLDFLDLYEATISAHAAPPVSSRDVLLHLYQATSSAHAAAQHARQNNFTAFGERIGDGVSANLCEALADIGGLRRSEFELRFAWAPAAPVEIPTPTVRFDRASITALKGGAKYLRKLPVTEAATVVGRVVELHRSPTDKLGKVQVEGVVEMGGERHTDRVTMRLAPRDYDLALAAHGTRKPLRVTGELRHTGRHFEISRVASVEIVEPPS